MLKLNRISKTFNPGTVNAKLALDDLTLHIRQGHFVSIIGANGAGNPPCSTPSAAAFSRTQAP